MKPGEWAARIDGHWESVSTDGDSMAIFLALLGRGYLPHLLPPPFTSQSFADAVEAAQGEFKDIIKESFYKKTTELCRYTVARPNHLRRIFGIPNPGGHFLLSLVLSDTFDDLHFPAQHDAECPSMSFPVFQSEGVRRAFDFITDWDEIPVRRMSTRSNGRFLLKADIARFFPSIYTHSIPWAMHGKSTAKENKFDYGLAGNLIDLLVRQSQGGQTLGVPIGPDTSFILAEKILLEIDSRLRESIKESVRWFHRVDDYEFVCIERADADDCVAHLQEALQEFELELNSFKTEICALPQHIQDARMAPLRRFEFGNRPERSLLEYFDLAFACFNENPIGTLKYAIRRLPLDSVSEEAVTHFLAQSMLLEPGAIQSVLTWVVESGWVGECDTSTLVEALSQVILSHGAVRHTSEVAWAIWGFLLLQEKLPKGAVEALCGMDDAIVLLLALDAREKGLLDSDELPAIAQAAAD